MKFPVTLFFILISLSGKANEIDLLKTNSDVHRFLIKHVSRQEFKDVSPFENYAKNYTGYVRNTFYKTDIDRNGETDLVIDSHSSLLVVMAFGKKYQLYHLDTSIGYSTPTNLVSIDSTAQLRKLIVQRQYRSPDTLVYHFNSFIEYTSLPDTNLSFDSLVWEVRWNGDPAVELKVFKNLSAKYSQWKNWPYEEPIKYSGIYSRKTYNKLIALLQYMRPQHMTKRYNNGSSHTDHCITRITVNGDTITIDDYGGDGTFALRQLYEIMHEIRETLKTQW